MLKIIKQKTNLKGYQLAQFLKVSEPTIYAWEKKNTPVFSGTATVVSPGHASFTKSPDGSEDWIVYHTAKHRGAGWNRNTRMQKFTWDIEGNPCFGYPVSEGLEIPAPSE